MIEQALAIRNNIKRVEISVNMITNGENEIVKLVCVDLKGNVGSPCGACREYMKQLSKNSKNIEILKDVNTKKIVKLKELIPNWWGYDRV